MTIAGIDLGTTNTVIALDGAAQPIGAFGATTLPSVVAFPTTGNHLVGSEARRRRATDPKNTIYGAKRMIAERLGSESVRKFAQRFPFDLVSNTAGIVAFRTRAGDLTSKEVGAQILRTALDAVGGARAITDAVLSVPSEFNEAQRAATMELARTTGLQSVRLLEEPFAAACAFVTPEEKLGNIGVYDFGGGTFDFAVVDCRARARVAHGGDLYLGGDDIDVGIARWVADRVLQTYRWDLSSDLPTFASLVAACEQVKIQLCEHDVTTLDLHKVDPAAPPSVRAIEVPRQVPEMLATKLAMRSFVICDDVLARARIEARSLDAVFLAGGATYLPQIRRMVAGYFGKEPRSNVNPLTVVACGASLAARLN